MANLANVVLLYGGKSGEHEISLLSAASVLANLDTNIYNIIPIGMDKDGRCYLNDYAELCKHAESLPVQTANSKPLPSLIIDGKFAVEADVVFPIVHGPLYEDGCLQGILELAEVAYVGCNVIASAMAMDKDITRQLLAGCAEFNMARQYVIDYHTTNLELVADKIIAEYGLPLFVKPNALGSSVGIHKVSQADDLVAAINDARRYAEKVVVQEQIVGREIELAVLENPKPHLPPLVSGAGEIKVEHSDGFYSYAAKYLESDQTKLLIPADLSADLLQRLQDVARVIFNKLQCEGLARVDFFVNPESEEIYFNEANTLPGFTTISMYPKLWQHSGIGYSDLLTKLIDLAQARKQRRMRLVTSYK